METLNLNFRFYPKEETVGDHGSEIKNLIILHGLFGSSKNWVTVSKLLSKHFNVYSLDLRNHGDSPHSEEHSIRSMSQDLEQFISDQKLENVSLLGHSMGGLVAMYFDLTHPGFLKNLIIQDISPRNYPFVYEKEIESMSFDLANAASRSEIDIKMKDFVPDPFIRQFLMMNLERNSEGKYFWKLNVKGIANERKLFDDVFSNLTQSKTRSLFLLGGISDYINADDRLIISNLFPHSQIKVIDGGGHYIHFTHSEEFMVAINTFINSSL